MTVNEFIPFSTKYSTKFLEEDLIKRTFENYRDFRTMSITHNLKKTVLPLDKSALAKKDKIAPCKTLTLKPLDHNRSVSNFATLTNNRVTKHLIFK